MSIDRKNLAMRVSTERNKFVDNKRRGLANAIKNSGQATLVYKLYATEFEQMKFKCLINSDKINNDYDSKIISFLEDDIIKVGDTFYWPDTDSYWIILLRDSSEKSYFKGFLRECQTSLFINDIEYHFWVNNNPSAFSAGWSTGAFAINNPNKEISCFITKNENTLNFFKNNEIIKWNGNNWKVETTDDFSMDGIIEVILSAAPNNKFEDEEKVEIQTELKTVDQTKPYITGKAIISPFESAEYNINGVDVSKFLKWNITSPLVEIISYNNQSILIKDTDGRSNTFNIQYILQDNSIAAESTLEVESF